MGAQKLEINISDMAFTNSLAICGSIARNTVVTGATSALIIDAESETDKFIVFSENGSLAGQTIEFYVNATLAEYPATPGTVFSITVHIEAGNFFEINQWPIFTPLLPKTIIFDFSDELDLPSNKTSLGHLTDLESDPLTVRLDF